MAMVFGGDGAKGFLAGEESFAFQVTADDFNESFRHMGEIAQGLMFDFAVLAKGVAEKKTLMSFLTVLANDPVHMDGSCCFIHSGILGLFGRLAAATGKYSWLQMESYFIRKPLVRLK